MHFKFAAAVVLALTVSACNVKLKSKGGDSGPPPEDKGIPGPDIAGTWLSDCSPDWMTTGYKMIEATYRNNSVSRKSRQFQDSNCTRLSNEKTENGTFKFRQASKDGAFTIEYRFPIGNGVYALPREKVLLENGILYISDYVVGDAVQKSLMLRAKKVAP